MLARLSAPQGGAAGQGGLDLSQVRSVYETSFRFDGDTADVHYPIGLLQDHPDRQTLTDSHYSDLGHLHLAAEVARVMLGRQEPEHVAARVASARTATVVGDLGVQCVPQRHEKRMRLPAPAPC
ncbi:hypothetical protein [Loktanella sp. M215]|uniref:hypothetical protein n=1 Tax=Loktanella sp. M215 TaxID=2675431 RepID=UPI001F2F994E|nr:hypothetical protein [Loktanella sp. M215]MCF7702148.1 hypothetical protein [Loktanella sp. M215]